MRKAEQKADKIEAAAAAQIRQIKAETEKYVKDTETAAQKQLAEMQNLLAEERTEKEYQIDLNRDLLRVARERANADRELRPKKEHTGYVVVTSAEKEYRYKADRRNWHSVMLWETVLQSPYSVDFTEEQARTQMKELFQTEEDSVWLIGRLGIDASYNGTYEDMLDRASWTKQQKSEYNIMLTRKLRANYKAGYWELVFLHTRPLGIVPKDMRAG